MNPFDEHITELLSRFAQKSASFDRFVVLLSDSDLLKGGVVLGLLWRAWFRRGELDLARRRGILVSGLALGSLATVLARGAAHFLPYRERPLYTPGFHFVPPEGISANDVAYWRAARSGAHVYEHVFPSDHAVLFVALATCIFLAWQTLGIVAYA